MGSHLSAVGGRDFVFCFVSWGRQRTRIAVTLEANDEEEDDVGRQSQRERERVCVI